MKPIHDARLHEETVQQAAAGDLPPRSRPPREPRRSPAVLPVDLSVVPALAIEAALRLAGGDYARLTFASDGTVTIQNGPRTAYRRDDRR